ncbi:hypothetical protein PoB_004425800, partial [Plakobranchus ocellatus]
MHRTPLESHWRLFEPILKSDRYNLAYTYVEKGIRKQELACLSTNTFTVRRQKDINTLRYIHQRRRMSRQTNVSSTFKPLVIAWEVKDKETERHGKSLVMVFTPLGAERERDGTITVSHLFRSARSSYEKGTPSSLTNTVYLIVHTNDCSREALY